MSVSPDAVWGRVDAETGDRSHLIEVVTEVAEVDGAVDRLGYVTQTWLAEGVDPDSRNG